MQAVRGASPVLANVIDFGTTLAKQSIKDAIAEKLLALIASGLLQIGDVLPSERDMASGLNVSRETIRGAVQALAARGFLEVSHGARTRVIRADVGAVTIGIGKARAVDAYGLEAVHAARLLIEREIVAQAARNIDAPTLARLDGSLKAQVAAVDDPLGFLITDREFHCTIYAAGGNALLADVAADLYAYMMQHRRAAVARPGAIALSIGDHSAILAGLHARDPIAAVAAFTSHTERIFATTQSVLGATP